MARLATTMRRMVRVLLPLALVGATVATVRPSSAEQAGTWEPTSEAAFSRLPFTATVAKLVDGRVLAGGGSRDIIMPGASIHPEIDIYDPDTGEWTPGPSITDESSLQSGARPLLVALADGGALALGFRTDYVSSTIAVYRMDAAATQWRPLAVTTDFDQTLWAELRDDGTVLVLAGRFAGSGLERAFLTFDPTTETFAAGVTAPTAVLPLVIGGHSVTSLTDGRVLLAGGVETKAEGTLITSVPSDRTVVYEPATDSWHAGPNLTVARDDHTASLLADGRVLIAGGETDTTIVHRTDGTNTFRLRDALASAEIVDVDAGTTEAVAPMRVGRRHHAAVVLDDGRVLVAGGTGAAASDRCRPLAASELYDDGRDVWEPVAPMHTARHEAPGFLLDDGSALVVGGWRPDEPAWCTSTAGDVLADAERFRP
ncbi:MAG: Kelch repeat-containing protein [Actinomycetota bacterium]